MSSSVLRILTHDLRYEQDVVIARQRARLIAAEIGLDDLEQTRIGTAVSEIARNAFRYAGGGSVAFEVTTQAPQALVVTVADKGSGIGDLELVTSGKYVSKTGMGMGILGARRLMDDFQLATSPAGTTVTMRKRIPPHLNITGREVAEITAVIQRQAAGTPLEELQSQNQELIRAIGEIQRRQAEIERLNDELKETNRGVLALNAELEDKADSLKNASETKSRFLSHMSHEFRTPLNSIRNLAKILASRLDGPLTQEQERQVAFIQGAAETLVEMVNDLLDLAKIEAGKSDINAREFTIAELFGAIRGMFRPLLVDSKVTLVFGEESGFPPLYTDESKLSQILRNFVSNAAKYTPEGLIEVKAAMSSDGMVRISVRDTGIGIAAEHVSRVFEEFVQIPNPLQKTAKGTGLGLPLSLRLAQLLGGTIEVESKHGEGSTFTVIIPQAAPGMVRPDGSGDGNARVTRVMIVDDSEVDRYTLRALLPRDCEITEVVRGGEAVAEIVEVRPALVFLDLAMPDVNGMEVLRQLHEEQKLSATSVVIHTSHVLTAAEVERLRSLGAVGVLPKRYSDLDATRGEIDRLIREAAGRLAK